MHKIVINLLIFFIPIVMISSCANWGGENPVGVTGGSGSGYGEMENWNPATDFNQLVGSWRFDYDDGDYIIFTFSADGSLVIDQYVNYDIYNTIISNYTVEEDILTITLYGENIQYTFSISGNILTLYIGGEQMNFYRVN